MKDAPLKDLFIAVVVGLLLVPPFVGLVLWVLLSESSRWIANFRPAAHTRRDFTERMNLGAQ